MAAIDRAGGSAWGAPSSRDKVPMWARERRERRGPSIPLQLRIRRLARDATPRVTLDAEDLLGFRFAEVMQMVDTGSEILRCLRCGTLFALGKVGQPPPTAPTHVALPCIGSAKLRH